MDIASQLWERITRLRITMKPPEKDRNEPIAYILPLNPAEAISHLLISGRETTDLSVYKSIPGCPVDYPIRLYNTRPVRLEIVGFTATILMNDKPVQIIRWNKPENQTSNGAPINHPVYLEGDSPTKLPIRVFLAQIATILPLDSPVWSAKGEIRFQGKNEIISKSFDFSEDYYKLSATDWNDLKKLALP